MQERKFSSWSTRWTVLIEICRFLALEIFLAISPRFCHHDFLFAVTVVFNFCWSCWLRMCGQPDRFCREFFDLWAAKNHRTVVQWHPITFAIAASLWLSFLAAINYSTFLRISKLFGKTHMRQRQKLGFLVNLFWGYHNMFY